MSSFKKWGVVCRVTGFVKAVGVRKGVSAKTNKAYEMTTFAIATGAEEYELAFGRDAKELEQKALTFREGDEVVVGCKLNKRRDDSTKMELVVQTIDALDGIAGTVPTAAAADEGGGGILGRRRAG